jgi:hypothetical protein
LGFGLVITAVKTKKYTSIDWRQRIEEFKAENQINELPIRADQVRHIIVIPNYKEEVELLLETLETLANHEMARTAYKVYFAFLS